MSDQNRAAVLSAVLLLATVVGTIALVGPTAAHGQGAAPADFAAAQANETQQVQPGESLVLQGTTSLSPEDNTIEVAVTSGPSADAFESVTVDEWGEDGQWNATLSVPEDAEPGSYEAEVIVGESNATVQFEVVEQVAAEGAPAAVNDTEQADNETDALGNETDALDNETGALDNDTEQTENETADGGLMVGNETDQADNETTTEEDGLVVGNETAADNETGAANVTNQTVNETPAQQVQPGETLTIRGTTSLESGNVNIVVEVTDGPTADVFESVTIDEWDEDGAWTADLQVPEDAEPGNYVAEISAGDFTEELEFEVVEQVAADNETTTTEEDGVLGDDNETTTAEDGVAADNETTTTEEDGLLGDDNETTTTEEDGAVGADNETTTTEEELVETTEEDAAANDTEPAAGEDDAADGTTTPGQPGFGIAVALVAAVVSLLVLARRQRD